MTSIVANSALFVLIGSGQRSMKLKRPSVR